MRQKRHHQRRDICELAQIRFPRVAGHVDTQNFKRNVPVQARLARAINHGDGCIANRFERDKFAKLLLRKTRNIDRVPTSPQTNSVRHTIP